jgi:hypothetical protein
MEADVLNCSHDCDSLWPRFNVLTGASSGRRVGVAVQLRNRQALYRKLLSIFGLPMWKNCASNKDEGNIKSSSRMLSCLSSSMAHLSGAVWEERENTAREGETEREGSGSREGRRKRLIIIHPGKAQGTGAFKSWHRRLL